MNAESGSERSRQELSAGGRQGEWRLDPTHFTAIGIEEHCAEMAALRGTAIVLEPDPDHYLGHGRVGPGRRDGGAPMTHMERVDQGKPDMAIDAAAGIVAKEAWTKKLWIYDFRTNKGFTLKQRRLVRADLDEFVGCYHPENRNQRKATWDEKKNPEGRWRVQPGYLLAQGRIPGGLVQAAGPPCVGG